MANCEFCKNTLQNKGACHYCGTVIVSATATFIYGQSDKASYGCAISVTNKYIIVRSVTKKELSAMTGAATMGLIGSVIGESINSSIKRAYGFYELGEIQKAIFPYHNYTLKKDTAVKFINHDGSDFIVMLNMNGLFSSKAARNFVDGLVKAGISVEDGSAVNYGSVYCSHPFVNETTFSTRVCSSAATFVQLDQKQFIAPAIGTTPLSGSSQQGFQHQIQAPKTTTMNINQANCSTETFVQPASMTTPYTCNTEQSIQSDITAKQKSKAVNGATKFCPSCGKQVSDADRFCGNCGHTIQRENETAKITESITWNADKWKSQW